MIYLLMEARNEDFNAMDCVGAFGTQDAAYRKMSELFDRCKGESDGDYTVALDERDVARVEDDYGNGMQWRIIETPGFVIPEADAATMLESINEADGMYADEDRDDWYDADDTCKNVCHSLEPYITPHTERG